MSILLVACATKKANEKKKTTAPMVELIIGTIPEKVVIYENGRDSLGETPLRIKRPANSSLRIKLVKNGYKASYKNVFLTDKKEQKRIFRMRPKTASLIVTSFPTRGASVILDGRYFGKTPMNEEIPLGKHHIAVLRPFMQAYEKEFEMKVALEKTKIRAQFIPLMRRKVDGKAGYLSVKMPHANGWVTLNKKIIGMAPLERIKIKAGEYRLGIYGLRDSKELYSQKIRINKAKLVDIDLKENDLRPK